MSVTMTAQADINDYMNAQVTGTEIFMEYDHQKMLDEINAQNLLLGSVTAPAITSGATGTDLVENTGAGQTVHTITATAVFLPPTYAIAGTDAALLVVDASTGFVTLTADPDYENQSSYSFTVTAIDAANNTSAATTVTVTFSITNVDDVIPTITSGGTGTDLVENSGAGQTIYTIASDANDGGTIQSYAIAGTDAALLGVDTSTGVVTLTADPDYNTKSSYSFTVTATDEAGTSAATAVTFAISAAAAPPAFVNCGDPYTYDGHSYATVQIGTQCWFAENLRTTVYADGSTIPEVTDNSAWAGLSTGARCDYDNDANNVATYGRMYNLHAVNMGNLCPSGWHVPTDVEYTTLTDFLGGDLLVVGGKMKSSASDSPAWDGTNTNGFSGLAGGWRIYNGAFYSVGSSGYFWSVSGTQSWYRRLTAGTTQLYRNATQEVAGLSVRCVQD